MDANLTKLMLDGTSTLGPKIISQHSNAVSAVADCVRSTLGPFGMQKLMIDETGEVIISNDGNCILSQLQVDNPIASLIIDLASEQDREVGDGTTSIILVVAELLKSVEKLFKQNISCSVVIRGFKRACRETIKYLTKTQAFKIDPTDDETLLKLALTSISSKIISGNGEHFAKLGIDAVRSVKLQSADVYFIDQLSMLKCIGQSIDDSHFLPNVYGLNCVKALADMPFLIKDAKIAALDFSLSKVKARMGVQVIVDNPESLREIRDYEIREGRNVVDLIMASGANVILTSGTIDESYCRVLAKKGIMAVKFVSKHDLKHIASCTGATVVKILDLDSKTMTHKFDTSLLGEASQVEQKPLGDHEAIFISEPKKFSIGCVILRGPSQPIIEELHRSLHDCFCAVKRALESKTLVTGGGSSEMAASVYLDQIALGIGEREQLVIQEFARALRIIPLQLAVNSGADATELVGNLQSLHLAAQKEGTVCHMGLDLEKQAIFDCKEEGILDPLMSKVKSLRKTTEAVIILAKIDNVIKNNPDKQQGGDGHGDDEFCG